ncbi:MAG: DUF3016 domain-containing protein [Thermomonas sp.]
MHRFRFAPFLLGAMLALGGCATSGDAATQAAAAPGALPEQGPVSVSWADPSTFSEARISASHQLLRQGDWLQDLAQYMRGQAERRLPPGDTLQLTILDVQRAGQYEPWRGPNMQDTRIIRDIYPPRMTLRFRQLDANGQVVAEGERRLIDPAFMQGTYPGDSDPLRYEKGLVDSWLRREFPAARASG